MALEQEVVPRYGVLIESSLLSVRFDEFFLLMFDVVLIPVCSLLSVRFDEFFLLMFDVVLIPVV